MRSRLPSIHALSTHIKDVTTVLRVAIFYPPEFLGTARRLIVVEFIPYSSDEPSAITFSAVFDTLALTVVSVVFVGSSVSRRSQTFGQIPPTMHQVRF
jgi:hypothetical protein